jgi:hypothetical protein
MSARRLLLVCLAVTVSIVALRHAGGKDLPPGAIQLRGAGSTFAAPLQKKSHSTGLRGGAFQPLIESRPR